MKFICRCWLKLMFECNKIAWNPVITLCRTLQVCRKTAKLLPWYRSHHFQHAYYLLIYIYAPYRARTFKLEPNWTAQPNPNATRIFLWKANISREIEKKIGINTYKPRKYVITLLIDLTIQNHLIMQMMNTSRRALQSSNTFFAE